MRSPGRRNEAGSGASPHNRGGRKSRPRYGGTKPKGTAKASGKSSQSWGGAGAKSSTPSGSGSSGCLILMAAPLLLAAAWEVVRHVA